MHKECKLVKKYTTIIITPLAQAHIQEKTGFLTIMCWASLTRTIPCINPRYQYGYTSITNVTHDKSGMVTEIDTEIGIKFRWQAIVGIDKFRGLVGFVSDDGIVLQPTHFIDPLDVGVLFSKN